MDSIGLKLLVNYNEDGTPTGFRYDKMILYITEILKEHDQKIMELEAMQTQVSMLSVQNDELRGNLNLLFWLVGGMFCLGLTFILIKLIARFSPKTVLGNPSIQPSDKEILKP